ncbi:hypothetical protein K8I61_17230 [bacterium]|nr:hypothetical protein [bacterium]
MTPSKPNLTPHNTIDDAAIRGEACVEKNLNQLETEKRKREIAEKIKAENRVFFTLAIKVAGVVFGLWLLFGWIAPPGDAERAGQFGDQFGSVNALFSGLAFAGVIVALIMQRRELQLQREQLEAQLEELTLARAESVQTRGVLALQQENMAQTARAQRLQAELTARAIYLDRHLMPIAKTAGLKGQQAHVNIEREIQRINNIISSLSNNDP